LELGGLTKEEADRIAIEQTQRLERELSVAKSDDYVFRNPGSAGAWQGYMGGRENGVPDPDTALDRNTLSHLLAKLVQLPAAFHPHPKIEKLLQDRAEMADGRRPLDWATAEAVALASLATTGHRIRLSGQDSRRGTFSQRHAALYDYLNGELYMPLQHLSPDQAPVEIYNSPLSEAGVLGFEYGYSLDCPDGLVSWEAQFGDFVNGAQIIIDQYIASAEDKWGQMNGLVLLLPHGYEGQGPEHSSARMARSRSGSLVSRWIAAPSSSSTSLGKRCLSV
jgi:2-oxoglutarate dehydrogenase E1 component